MTFVGGSVAVSGLLADAPILTAQALRYAVAFLLLIAYARGRHAPLVRPRGTEWWWLAGVVLTGMVVFNLALVHGARHAEPAVLGVAVACVPVLFAVAGPILQGHRPATRVVTAALVVTVGAALVQGLGRADRIGLAWAVVTFACEAGFTLLTGIAPIAAALSGVVLSGAAPGAGLGRDGRGRSRAGGGMWPGRRFAPSTAGLNSSTPV